MNHVALRRLIGGSVLVWTVCTVVLMTHPVPPQQRVGAQEAPTVPPTASATAEAAPEQLARPVYLPLIQQGQGTAPDIQVDAAATARYVRCDWNDMIVSDVTGETQLVPIAYVKGYTAQSGSPLNDIILAFGRQVEPGRAELTEWGVQLVPPGEYEPCENDNGVRDREWVISVAEAYIDGYTDNSVHRAGRIAIGTNNSNFPWNCDNQGLISGLWRQAGQEWRLMLDEIDVSSLRVRVIGANDVESWWSAFPITDNSDIDNDGDTEEQISWWVACGIGTRNWFEGYEVAADTIIPVINFGSNAWSELQGQSDFGVDWSLQWTQEQLFDVSISPVARSYPQIYCEGNEDGWLTLADNAVFRDRLFFSGVTSENNGNNTCGSGSLTVSESWMQLYDGLVGRQLETRLAPSVSSFCLRPYDNDGSMSCSILP